MPTYEYRCSECGHAFDELESMSAAPLTDCPKCHKPSLKRLMAGGMGMVFKGSGFYKTDYAKPGSSKAEGGKEKGSSPKPDPAKSENAASSKSPAKSEGKPSSDPGSSAPKT